MSIIPSGSPIVPSTLQSQTTGTTPASRAVNEANMQSILDGLTRLDSDIDAVASDLAAEAALRDASDDAHDLKLAKLESEYFLSGQWHILDSNLTSGESAYAIATMVPVPPGKVARIVEWFANGNNPLDLALICDKGSSTPPVTVATGVIGPLEAYAGDTGKRDGFHSKPGTPLVFYDNSAGAATYYPTLQVKVTNNNGYSMGLLGLYGAWVRVQIT
jgi:hypothetical protein